jgi:hypothetical protein
MLMPPPTKDACMNCFTIIISPTAAVVLSPVRGKLAQASSSSHVINSPANQANCSEPETSSCQAL